METHQLINRRRTGGTWGGGTWVEMDQGRRLPWLELERSGLMWLFAGWWSVVL